MQRVRQLITERLGMKDDILSSYRWEEVIMKRMSVCKITNSQEYFERLILSPEELSDFIELIVIPETWFFREPEVFNALIQILKHNWTEVITKRSLNILSIGCSTGEEPYSIAISLSEAGLPNLKYHIEGLDISQRAIDSAKKGIYGKNSFRGRGWQSHSHFFHKLDGDFYAVSEDIKKHVKFSRQDVLDPYFQLLADHYHVIFCRNTLIYFNRDSKIHLLKKIKEALVPNGMLIVSMTEAGEQELMNFFEAPFPIKAVVNAQSTISKEKRTALLHKNLFDKSPVDENLINKSTSKKETEPKKRVTMLQRINLLANQGQYDEAISLCLDYLAKYGEHAQIYYWLGIMQQIRKDDEKAEWFFRKSLLINPSHNEALKCLDLLYNRQGRLEEAEQLKKTFGVSKW